MRMLRSAQIMHGGPGILGFEEIDRIMDDEQPGVFLTIGNPQRIIWVERRGDEVAQPVVRRDWPRNTGQGGNAGRRGDGGWLSDSD